MVEFDTQQELLIIDLETHLLRKQNACHSHNPTVISSEAGEEEDLIPLQCYNFGQPGYLSFSPNLITDPAYCSQDSYWLYTARTLEQTLPLGMQIGVDSLNKQVRWGSIAEGQ